MSYAILCDARKGQRLGIETLALVDRSLSKSIWWTSDRVDLILNYRKLDAANFAVKRLKMNRARVVSYDFAERVIRGQAESIQLHESSN